MRDLHAARSRSSFQQWDDDLLYALLSHRLLASGGARTLDIFAELAHSDEAVAGVLERLFVDAQQRWGRGRYGDYDPSGATYVQRLAVYSANLVMLRLEVGPEPLPIRRLSPAGADATDWWRSFVRLWSASLSAADLKLLVNSMGPDADGLIRDPFIFSGNDPDILADWLAGDVAGAMRRAAGKTLLGGRHSDILLSDLYSHAPILTTVSNLAGRLVFDQTDPEGLHRVLSGLDLEEVPADSRYGFLRLVFACIDQCRGGVDYSLVMRFVGLAMSESEGVLFYTPMSGEILTADRLTSLVVHYPRLLVDIPGLPMQVSFGGDLRDRQFRLAAVIDDEKGRLLRARLERFWEFAEYAELPEANFVRALPPDVARRAILGMALPLTEPETT